MGEKNFLLPPSMTSGSWRSVSSGTPVAMTEVTESRPCHDEMVKETRNMEINTDETDSRIYFVR